METGKKIAAKPFIKWVGGKRQLIKQILPFVPPNYGRYFEPFVGGGALLFELKPIKATIGDINQDLIFAYKEIKRHPDELIEQLKKYKVDQESFLSVRSLDRDLTSFARLSSIEKAARLIYLNKTCYNGCYRVNSRGQFNVPFAGMERYTDYLEEDVIRADHEYLNQRYIRIQCCGYKSTVAAAKKGDFVYFDPPYHCDRKDGAFDGYSMKSFTEQKQKDLAALCLDLTKKGVFVMVSNSCTQFIKDIYSNPAFHIYTVKASRRINRNVDGRGMVEEVLITNFDQRS